MDARLDRLTFSDFPLFKYLIRWLQALQITCTTNSFFSFFLLTQKQPIFVFFLFFVTYPKFLKSNTLLLSQW